MPLDILFQDEECVAIIKPPGLLVHRSSLAFGETDFAMTRLRDQIGQPVYPVHRLDRPTSGILLFALNPQMARDLANEFAERRVEKVYLAVVRGVAPIEAIIDHPLKEELDPLGDPQSRHDKEAQQAITRIQTLGTYEFKVSVDKYPTSRYSLVRAIPETGRRHQIRRHLRHIGHPIIGDVNHGVGKHNRFFAETLGIRRLLLACTELAFQHPRLGRRIHIRSPLCEDYQNLLKRLQWDGVEIYQKT